MLDQAILEVPEPSKITFWVFYQRSQFCFEIIFRFKISRGRSLFETSKNVLGREVAVIKKNSKPKNTDHSDTESEGSEVESVSCD